jgi:hypothetical protein
LSQEALAARLGYDHSVIAMAETGERQAYSAGGCSMIRGPDAGTALLSFSGQFASPLCPFPSALVSDLDRLFCHS